MNILAQRVSLNEFYSAVTQIKKIIPPAETLDKIQAGYSRVEKLMAGNQAIYGLNTGLGANVEHRIDPQDIPQFQHQIIAGRAVACGEPISEEIARGVLLYRIVSAAKGYSGIGPVLFTHLCNTYNAEWVPLIPQYGSIGASDLTQNAHFALGICGTGKMIRKDQTLDSKEAYSRMQLDIPPLLPKEGLAMINHSGVSTSLAGCNLHRAQLALLMMKHAIVLSYLGYDANRLVLSENANTLRQAPGQQQAAQWFRTALENASHSPRRIQEALSFRTVAPVVGASGHALLHASSVWEDEFNGVSDSPVVLPDGSMLSTPNFHPEALSQSLQGLSVSLLSVANGSVQRMQRIMNPELSGLPKYLTNMPRGAAGMVATQKTALSLLAEITLGAQAGMQNPVPVSDSVEDMATMATQAATKLEKQLVAFELLAGLEALVACQAIDLRQPTQLGKLGQSLHQYIREEIDFLTEDRALGSDIELAKDRLANFCSD